MSKRGKEPLRAEEKFNYCAGGKNLYGGDLKENEMSSHGDSEYK